MTILYLIPHLYNSGGMERVLCQKVNWLATHTPHRIIIGTTEPTPAGQAVCFFPLADSVQIASFDIDFDADFKAPLLQKYRQHQAKMRQYKKRLRSFIIEQHIDLCISLGGKEIAFLTEMPCRCLAELHFAKNERLLRIQAHHSGLLWSLLGRIRVRQMVREMKRFHQFVVLTEADRQQWAAAGCKQAIVIPNPCSLSSTPLPTKQREKEVLAVGRLHPQKGYDRLLEAWHKLESAFPDWRLTIVGEGPDRFLLQDCIRAHRLQHVTLAGAHDHIEQDYCRASILAMTSRYEGLPLAMIEAMWCGTPCVSMDCPHGPKELLAQGGGILTPEGDINAFAEALSALMSDSNRRDKEGKQAAQIAHQLFSEETIMQQWLQLITDEHYSR